MTDKRFTILIVPEDARRVRRFMLPGWTVRACCLAMAAVVLGVALLAAGYVRRGIDREELARLRQENTEQRLELARLSTELQTLNRDLTLLAQNDAQVRNLTSVQAARPDALTGIGGPPEPELPNGLSDLQERIDQVRRQIDLQRLSQEEIQAALNDQRSLLAAKPQGWPVKGWLTSTFGMRKSPFTGRRKMHEGLDIAARTGTPVHATADGVVTQAGIAPGYGKLVVIDHGYGYKTYYAHNSRIYVKVGQRVRRGDRIAAVGNTGSSTGSHVHYEVRRNGVPVNPRKFL
ncbi:murein DD-endopeptidase MepM/ murein hydrolase activator NlpD [Geothermobacter ehrlichii]|uniref:Murein DD-endopeptidase MepM/ murein hydrolase activator NlpD n=1 Tax=Geothermobacter ehrlichii TaxID=213224 RepID=A0A5D3WIZ2_9BACT|nr:M23 family metallopeptidase [Geothermobacter ehrlichii]TYO98241.1 murein DD-endopeptidase MepM/ murein hydrolase activator NlpD [Geothermobacter ehrlichii]